MEVPEILFALRLFLLCDFNVAMQCCHTESAWELAVSHFCHFLRIKDESHLKKKAVLFFKDSGCAHCEKRIYCHFFFYLLLKQNSSIIISLQSCSWYCFHTMNLCVCVCVCGDITLVTGKTDLGPGNIMSPLKDITVKYTMWKGPYTLFQFYGFMMRTWWKKSSGPNSLRSG